MSKKTCQGGLQVKILLPARAWGSKSAGRLINVIPVNAPNILLLLFTIKPMDLRVETISNESFVTELVLKDYRTSDIFRKYNISYCCGGKISLQAACEMYKIDIDVLKK